MVITKPETFSKKVLTSTKGSNGGGSTGDPIDKFIPSINPGFFCFLPLKTDTKTTGDKNVISMEVKRPEDADFIKELINNLGRWDSNILFNIYHNEETNSQDKKMKPDSGVSSSDQNPLVFYEIPDLSKKSEEEFIKYVKANNLSKSVVKAYLSNNDKWREIEDMVFDYFRSEREEARDICLSRRAESYMAQRKRLKALTAFQDEMRQIDAEIWASRCKTNEKISDIYYKALFGGSS